MADIDRLEVQVEAQASKANKQLDNLIEKLEKVSSTLTGVNASGLTGFANGISKIAGASAQLGNVKTADFTRLAKNLEKIAGVDQSALNRTSASLTAMSQSLGKIKGASQSATQISELAKNISKLGNKSVQNAMENMPKLASGLNDMMTTLSKAPTVSNNLIQMTNALASLASQGSKVGAAINSVGATGSKGTSLLSGWLNRLTGSTGKATRATKSFSQIAGSFYANFYVVTRGLRSAWSSVESSMDFLETVNYFEVAMRKLGDDATANWKQAGYESAEAYAKSFSERAKQLTAKMTGYEVDEDGNATYTGLKNLGMNPDTVMNYQAMFAQVSESIGVAEESALNFSTALTMLGADWASLRNTTFEQAFEKFASALAGQSRAVRAFGIDITNATLQEYAYKYGLTTAIAEMNQATKAQLRLLAILDQSKVAYGDLANTMESPSNQLRMLRQNVSNLARTIGNLFLPVVEKVLPYINGLVMAIQRLFTWIGGLLGIEFSSINSSIGGMDNGVEDLVDGVDDAEDSLNGANDAAKKLKNTILGFDEINQLNDNSDSSSGGSGSGGGIGGGSALLDEEIADALARYQEEWDKAFDRMENKAQDIADRICNAFKRGDYEGIGSYISNGITKGLESINWNSVYGVSKNFGKGFAEFLNGLISPSLFGAVGKTIAGALNTAIYAELFFGENFDWKNLGNSIANGINNFFRTFDFGALAQTFNVWAKGILDAVITALDNTDWELIGRQIGTFFAELDFMEVGAKIGQAIWKAINAGIDVFKGIFDAAPVETTIVTMLGFSKVWKVIAGNDVISRLKKVGKGWKTFSEAIFLSTKALEGNQTATNLLNALYPKLGKKVDSVKTKFTSFKNLFKGNFFQNLDTSINEIRNNMSGMTKGAITAVAGFAEFKVVSGTFKDLVNGSENLVAGIGKIAGIVAVAGAAMYTAFGPAGLVIAAITGVVGAVKGINDAFEEINDKNIGNAIKEALTNPGGISLDDLAEQFKNKISSIGDGFKEIADKSKQLDEADSSIKDTIISLEAIDIAMDTNAISVEEGCSRIITALGNLATESSDKISQLEETLLSALGEGGIMYEMLETLGYDVEGLKNAIVQTSEEAQNYIKALTDELDTLDETNPENATRIREIKDELASFMAQADETTKSYNAFYDELENNKINIGDILEDDGLSYKEEELSNFLNSLSTSVTETRDSVEEGVQGIVDKTADLKGLADKLGLDENSAEFKAALNAYAEALEATNGNVDKATKALTDTLETQLVDGISDVVEKTGEEWEKLGGIEQFFEGTKDEYIKAAVDRYQKNVINPVSEGIKGKMDELAIDGSGWAKDAAEEIIDSMFSSSVKSISVGYADMETTLNKNYKEIIHNVLEDTNKETKEATSSIGKSLGEVGNSLGGTSAAFSSLSDNIKSTTDSSANSISSFGYSSSYNLNSLGNPIMSTRESFVDLARNIATSSDSSKTAIGLFGDKISSVMSTAIDKVSGFSQNANSKFDLTIGKANSLTGTLDDTTESAKKLYDQSGKTFEIKTDTNSFSTLRGAISGVFDAVNNLFSFNGRTLAIGGGVGISGTGSIGIRGYATGGFPTSGELFMARENGITEMVGRFGSRAAVAPNDQIVEGIQSGVEAAMMNVMMAFAGSMGGNNEPPIIENVWKCDSETLYKATQKGKEKHDRRYHTVTEI